MLKIANSWHRWPPEFKQLQRFMLRFKNKNYQKIKTSTERPVFYVKLSVIAHSPLRGSFDFLVIFESTNILLIKTLDFYFPIPALSPSRIKISFFANYFQVLSPQKCCSARRNMWPDRRCGPLSFSVCGPNRMTANNRCRGEPVRARSNV